MECTRCGGSMMPETVIRLRRSFIGFRETRSRGAYCPTCKIGVPMESPPTCHPTAGLDHGAFVRPHQGISATMAARRRLSIERQS
jgi:hypothetical protein